MELGRLGCIVAGRKTGDPIQTMKKSQKQAQRAQARGVKRAERRLTKEKRTMAPAAYNTVKSFSIGRRERSRPFFGRELIGDVNGSVALTITRYAVNPGIASTFPRLSAEAAKWDQYRFHKLRFCYVNRCGSDTVGTVILSPDYNPRDPTPTTDKEISDAEDAKDSGVWVEFSVDLDVNAMFGVASRKLIRNSNVSGDINLYDAAAFFVGTVGETGTSQIGRLWVEYEGTFFVPQNSPADYAAPSHVSWCKRAAAQSFTTATPAALQFDAFTFDPLGIGDAATGVFTPTAGSYAIRAIGSFNDNTNESFTALIDLQKNGSSVQKSQANVNAGGSTMHCSLEAVVELDGDDTIDLIVTLTGAAGTLTSLANNCSISFVPA